MNYIYQQNKKGAGTKIPLEGFGIGNGLTDPYIQFEYYASMAYNSSTAVHSPYSGIPISHTLFNVMESRVPACQKEIEQCNNGGSSNVCDNAYSTCMNGEVEPVTATGVNPYNLNIKCQVPGLCYDFSTQTTWLNNKTVQTQIGVDMKWESCNTLVNIRLEADWMKDYQQLLVEPIENGVRALIYAGDLDFICNWLGNQAWALALPWTGQKSFDDAMPKAWMVNGKQAGELRQGSSTAFSFLRVYQAGHMVPMDQPLPAVTMLDQFITDTL
jgi:cathepsin A (carboxypeptidase C)